MRITVLEGDITTVHVDAIVNAAQERGLRLFDVQDFDSPTGKGVTGTVEGQKLVIGNQRIMTEAGIDAGFTRDLYVALGEPLEDGAWAVRVHIKPYVRWIWLGGLMMGLGGLLAALDPRYRVKVRTRVRDVLGMKEATA